MYKGNKSGSIFFVPEKKSPHKLTGIVKPCNASGNDSLKLSNAMQENVIGRTFIKLKLKWQFEVEIVSTI